MSSRITTLLSRPLRISGLLRISGPLRISKRTRVWAAGVLALVVSGGVTFGLIGPADATSTDVVISQVYGGGGNSGATYTNDYVQLTNRGSTPADLSGWSVQYASATGTSWQHTDLSGTIAPGATYLVGEAAGSGGTTALPDPNVTGTIAMSATSGRVALVTENAALGCGTSCAQADGVRDFVGYGSAVEAEGNPVPALSATTAALRTDAADTDDNATDFTVGAPDPAGTGGGTTPPPAEAATIHQIQGAAHLSPLNGQAVTDVTGVVTAVGPNGFWYQDTKPDNDPATSEGLYVFTDSAPTVARGDAVSVAGTVSEYRPGGDATNLTVTELDDPTVTVTATGATLPAPTLIGAGGLTVPAAVRTDDPGDVEKSSTFDPQHNALDFYESLEGMLVEIRDATAVGPTSSYDEVPVLPAGSGGLRTPTGGIKYTGYDDANPQRLYLGPTLASIPQLNVGDTLPGAVDGVLDYQFGNYYMYPLATPATKAGGTTRTVTRPQRGGELAIATYNVENLAPSDPASKFSALADGIVKNLAAPDIVAVEEVQDNDGATDDGVVAADQTWNKLIDAIVAAGGPRYQYRQIDPTNDADGGEPGGNIRVGFLFRTDRGLRFVDHAPGDATTATTVVSDHGKPELTHSPGRIAPADSAWADSRKPLVGQFTYHGKSLFVVANHFVAKLGDDPLMGRYQPPARPSDDQRTAQARLVADFVDSITAVDSKADVVVVGDLNDFEFSDTAKILTADGTLTDLVSTLPENQRYTYVYEGNSEVLDHIMISRALLPRHDYQVVHLNSEFADQTSDHDPQIVRLRP